MLEKALLVIDYIKGISSGSGTCARYLEEHPEVINNTNSLIDFARNHDIKIVHIRLAFDPTYSGLPKYAPSADMIRQKNLFQIDSESTEFIADIHFETTDTVIEKSYGDIFHGNNLINTLKDENIEEVIFTGVSTDNAILNGANTAIQNDFFVSIVADACGAPTEIAHENALSIMKGRTASQIISTAELLKKLSDSLSGTA